MRRFVHVVHVVCEYAQVVNIELRLSNIFRLLNTICGRNVGAMALSGSASPASRRHSGMTNIACCVHMCRVPSTPFELHCMRRGGECPDRGPRLKRAKEGAVV